MEMVEHTLAKKKKKIQLVSKFLTYSTFLEPHSRPI